MPGDGAKKRKRIRRAQEKKALKKTLRNKQSAASEQANDMVQHTFQHDPQTSRPVVSVDQKIADVSPSPLSPSVRHVNSIPMAIPSLTEVDLLAFQSSHFGDESKPENWFIDAETALSLAPQHDENQCDDLGYYEDGVQRTLTDEQIFMFRHSEIERILRQHRIFKEEQEDRALERDREYSELSAQQDDELGSMRQSHRASKEKAIGLEDIPDEDLRSSHAPALPQVQLPPNPKENVSGLRPSVRKIRKGDIPYKDRHKRKWEQFIQEEDPEQGSLTHRRIIREMDQQHTESVDMDYGDEALPKTSSSSRLVAPPGRRIVTYEDD